MVQSLWKTVWRFLKKLKIELPYDPAVSLLGIYPKEMTLVPQRDTSSALLTAALFMIVKIWKQPMCPSINGCMDKDIVFALNDEKLYSSSRYLENEAAFGVHYR